MKSTSFDIHIHSSATSGYINMGVAAREAFDTERLDLGIFETLFRNHDTHHRHVCCISISGKNYLKTRLSSQEASPRGRETNEADVVQAAST